MRNGGQCAHTLTRDFRFFRCPKAYQSDSLPSRFRRKRIGARQQTSKNKLKNAVRYPFCAAQELQRASMQTQAREYIAPFSRAARKQTSGSAAQHLANMTVETHCPLKVPKVRGHDFQKSCPRKCWSQGTKPS